MNTLFFKYALEVEHTGSISSAADNLFMAQPNLSRAIKEIEDTFKISIFERTSKGVVPTAEGKKFLQYARNILEQMDLMEEIAESSSEDIQKFKISIPRSSYAAAGLVKFISQLDLNKGIDLNIIETNSVQTVRDIAEGRSNLGIVRYQNCYEAYYVDFFREKNVKTDLIWDFECLILFSADSPLASKETVTADDLREHVQISHGDLSIPYLDADSTGSGMQTFTKKNIHLYERGNQFEILSRIPNTFMWVSPVPEDMLVRYHLVQRKCRYRNNRFKDVLVYKNGYQFGTLDKLFIERLYESKALVCYQNYM